MSGLDKILEGIKKEADAKTEEILSAAKEKADALIKAAETDAAKTVSDSEARTERECGQIVERAHSSAQLKQQKMILEKKQELIGEVMAKAKKALDALSEGDYFAMIEKLASRFNLKEPGTVHFAKKDLDRLPAGFAEKLGKAVGNDVTIADEPANIDGGFVLSYGGIEENCSFDTMFRSEKEQLQDIISGILFKDETSN
ncbi:MAG: hypothetical protein II787_02200 [Lachnospiraceae bacterium]|nr:hypothetical protein [Lachnospiraceae bacterium]